MGTSTIANLVVAIEANTASFSTGMQRVGDQFGQMTKNMEAGAAKARSALVGLTAGISVGALAKSAIDAADAVHKLAQQTGIAAQDIDQLTIVAKLNDVEAASLVKSYKALATAMNEASDPTSKQAKMFEALGVATRDGNGNLRNLKDVTLDIAKVFSEADDGPEKMAVAVGAFGKAGLEMIPVLNNMAEDMKKAALAQEAFGKISTDTAAAGDQFNDSMTLLGEGLKRIFLPAVDSMGPAMDRFTTAMIATGQSGSALSPILNVIFKEILPAAVETVGALVIAANAMAKALGNLIGGLAAAMGQLASGNFSAAWQTVKDAFSDSDQIIADSNVAIAGLMDRSNAAAPAIAKTADATNKMAAAAGALGGSTKGARRNFTEFTDEILKLQDQMAKLVNGDGGYVHMAAAQEKVRKALLDGVEVTNEAIDAYFAAARALDEQEKAAKELAATWESLEKFLKEGAKAQEEIDDAIMKANQSIKAQNDALKLEHETLGLTDNARKQWIATKALEQAVTDQNTNAIILLREQLDLLSQQATDTAFLDMANAARQSLEQAAAFASDFFVDLFNNGSKAFKNLWESFKQLAFRAIADVAAKQLVVSLTGIGGAGFAGAANASGGGGIGGLLDGIKSVFGGGFGGGGGLLGAAGGFGGAQTAALDSMLLTSGFGSLAGGGLTAALGPVVAALPWAGLAAIAIPMISKIFDKGPAMRTGTFTSGNLGSDASRDLAFSGSSAFGMFGISKDKWLNPDDAGAGAAFGQLASSITKLDNAIAAMVGGELTKEIADALAQHSVTVGLGKEHTDINASGGPAEILKDRYVTVLSAIDAQLGAMVESFQGTGDELANFVVSLVGMRQALGNAFKDLDAADITALGEAFGGMDKLASGLAFISANFVAEADKAITAQQSLVDSFSELGLAVPATHQAFRDLLSSFDLTTDSGRDLYASVMGLSGAFVEVNGTATQAMESLRASLAGLEQARGAFLGTSQSTVAQNQVNALVGQFAANRDWALAIVNASGVTGLVQTLSQIVQSDFANYSASDQALITQILSTAASARDQGGAWGAPQPYGGPNGYTPAYPSPAATAEAMDPHRMAEEMMQKFSALTDQSTGDYGAKLALQIRLVTGAMESMVNNPAMAGVRSILYNNNLALNASVKLFGELSARYSDSVAEQLVKLTESYNKQVQDLQGNAAGLDVLNIVFEEQWQAIINGTAKGVDGAIGELKRLQDGILGYVDSLKIGADSPLTAMQKLAEARSQYEGNLAKANMGDQKALGDITGSADAYIKLARDYYASSTTYTDLFNQITGELTALGTKDFGSVAMPLNAADQALMDALPVGSKLMSAMDLKDAAAWMANATGSDAALQGWQLPVGGNTTPGPPVATSQDIKDLATALIDAIYEAAMLTAKSGTDDAGKVTESVDKAKAAWVEALMVGKK